jgi:hypothetical protein
MEGQVVVTRETLLSLAASLAIRQLSHFGVKPAELESLRHQVQSAVDRSEGTIQYVAQKETDTLRAMLEDDDEQPEVEFVMLLSVYADAGVRIACQIQRQRLAEAN